MPRRPSSDIEFVQRASALWGSDYSAVGEMGYHPRLFCQLALPYKDLKHEPSFWERRNGDFTLTVRPSVETAEDGRRHVAYPFGSVPRLLLSWLATEAVRTREPTLMLGSNLSDFMGRLGMTPTGGKTGTITRLRRQMNRLFDATITAEYHGDRARDIGHNFTIATSKSLWWSEANRDAAQSSLLPSTVKISDEFFRELIEHPVPVSVEALRLLQSSPLRLDIYTWLTHRNSYAKGRSNITWRQLQSQFGSATSTETWRGRNKFKEGFINQLKYVLAVYPEAKIDVQKDGVVVWPAPTHVRRSLSSGRRP